MSSHQVHELGLRTEPQASPFSACSLIIFDKRVLSLDQLVWVSLMILVNRCSSCKIIDNILNSQSFMCEHFGTLSTGTWNHMFFVWLCSDRSCFPSSDLYGLGHTPNRLRSSFNPRVFWVWLLSPFVTCTCFVIPIGSVCSYSSTRPHFIMDSGT